MDSRATRKSNPADDFPFYRVLIASSLLIWRYKLAVAPDRTMGNFIPGGEQLVVVKTANIVPIEYWIGTLGEIVE